MKLLVFSDIHFHHTHRFSYITQEGYSVRELEHLSCANDITKICQEEDISEIVFLGDMFGPVGDNVSTQTLSCVTEFLNRLKAIPNTKLRLLTGNHDISGHLNNQYAHKLKPFCNDPGLTIYDEPTILGDFVFMPYCVSDDYAQNFLEQIEDKENKVLFSHLNIKGIEIGTGLYTKVGVDLNLLKQFRMVLQGHYHIGGKLADNIYICGSTQRLSFKDSGTSRNNIMIYDTETNTITRRSFHCPDWLTFNDETLNDLLKIGDDNYVKVEVTSDMWLTDDIKEKLERVKGKDIHVVVNRISLDRRVDENITSEDELSIIKQFIDKTENTPEQKTVLIEEGQKLLKRVLV